MKLGETRHPAAALALILTAAFMVVLDFSIVNVALSAIERELHARTTDLQWVITTYAITFGGLLVLGGRMGDLWGRRRMFVVGLVLFALASFGGGLSGDLGMLLAARAIQGVGAALVAPAALSLITTSVPEGPRRTRALGYYGATASIGFVAGLVLGGLLVQFFDWRAVFWVNVPIGLAAALLTPALIPAVGRMNTRHRLDLAGALLITGAIAAAVYSIAEGPQLGWRSIRTVEALLVALFLFGTFMAVEQRHPVPLVRLGLFRLRSLRMANLYIFSIGAWSAGEMLVVPLYFQLALHYSPLATGFALAPQGVVGFAGAAAGARVVRKVGIRAFLIGSGLSAALGLLLLALALGVRSYPFLLVGFVFTGYGTATGAFGSTVVATQGIDDAEQGLAGGLITMSRQIGAALGVAVVAAVIGTSTISGSSLASDRSAILVTASAAALAAILAIARLTEHPSSVGQTPAEDEVTAVRDSERDSATASAERRLQHSRPAA